MTKKKIISAIGWIGIVAIILAYALLSFNVIGKGTTYDLLNLFGAMFVVIDAIDDKAYPPAVLNTVWFVIALISLIS